jgi:hypothetical protein
MRNHLHKTRRGKVSDKYRRILNMLELADGEVRKIQKNLRLLAQALGQHVRKKKFH